MTTRAEPATVEPLAFALGTWDARPLAGVLLFILGASFLTVTMLAASIAPGYDYRGGAISDLGVIGETAILFNVQLIVTGTFNIAAGWLIFRTDRQRWLLIPYLLGGIGAIGAGLVPLDTGDLHALFALIGFIFFNLQAVATGFAVHGPMRSISFVSGLTGLAFVAVMIVGDGGNPAIFGAIGHGGAERMIVFPAMLWAVAFGGYLTAKGERRRHEKPRTTA